MVDMFQVIWDEMVKERQRVNGEFEKLRTEIDAAVTIIMQDETDLPLAVNGMSRVEIRWCSNGLKDSETTGNGTGVLVYYNSSDDTWKRFSDDTTVAT
jgi:hypothetical protein